MKLAAKMGIGMGLVAAMMIAAASWSAKSIVDTQREVAESVRECDAAMEYERGAHRAREGAELLARGQRVLGVQAVLEGRREMEDAGAALRAGATAGAERAELDEIARVEGLMREALDRLDADTKRREAGDQALIAQELAFMAARGEALSLRLTLLNEQHRAAEAAALARMYALNRMLAALFFAAALVAIAGAFALTRHVVAPLKLLARATRQIGAGALVDPIPLHGDDEVAQLARSFEEMSARLGATMSELSLRNDDMSRVFQHIDQGLLTIDRAGRVSRERSAVIGRWLPSIRTGLPLWEGLASVDPSFALSLGLGWQALLDDGLPLSVLTAQMARRFTSGERTYEAHYRMIYGREGLTDENAEPSDVSGALVIISDVTQKLVAERADAEQRAFIAVCEKLLQDRRGFLDFYEEAGALVDRIVAKDSLALKSDLHTLKGNASLYGLCTVADQCEALESRLADECRPSLNDIERARLSRTWRSFVQRVGAFIGVTARRGVVVEDSEYEHFRASLLGGAPPSELARILASWKLDPAAERLRRLAAQAEVLASRVDKLVNVEVVCGPLRVPGKRWDGFWTALVHVLRNAIDHGIESPAERIACGKKRHGLVRLIAEERDGEVAITVLDDGRGVAWERIGEKAKRLGLPCDAREHLVDAVFHEGLSSLDESTALSGRGVGMSAVREACRAIGGRVEIVSPRDPSGGTEVRFVMPDPLAGARSEHLRVIRAGAVTPPRPTCRSTGGPCASSRG